MMILPRRGSDRVPDSVVLVIFVVAASLGTVFAKDTAFVEVVLFESSPNGDYTTYTTGLQGRFSKAGATISAEGEIVQSPEGFALPCVYSSGQTSAATQKPFKDAQIRGLGEGATALLAGAVCDSGDLQENGMGFYGT
ncbi:E3 ubiquitin-protein ligase znrf3 [Dissostichus eleginoides]|uniref:E3 ubiquitin-protein ligase znrf3 n=1 Tax=Dissostichus eleginoides TaxID=100907 RepID=A0AAD9F8S5_DISEL|nr:E3 ubiquitin-protein ligase znrf3 [Dissostichus eleginoides]